MVARVVRGRLLVSLMFLALSSACDDLSEYRGEFEGGIVQGTFVRSCFSRTTRATLQFDPDRAVGDVSRLPVSARNWLSTSDGTFERTPLEPMQSLAHDQLSLFDFPGPRRLRNYMLLARPEKGPLAQRDALVVVSLLENGRVEVRVIARTDDASRACAVEVDGGVPEDGGVEADAGAPSEGPGVHEYFGLFTLSHR
jgi:hypothetical protein